MAKRDYYEVLGISRTATADEIKKAHRKLVRQHHPDVNKNNKASEEKFKEAQEAYDVLSDTAKRKAYDQFGHAGVGAGGPGGAGGNGDPWEAFRRAGGGSRGARGGHRGGPGVTVEDFEAGEAGNAGDFSEIFEQLFGGRGGGFAGRAGPRGRARPATAPERGADIEHPVSLTFEQAARGVTLPLQITRDGKLETIDVKIPPGVKDGSRVRIRGRGQHVPGAEPGDLYIVTTVQLHEFFRREDLDVLLDVPLSLYEAILGTKVNVPTLDGPVTITVPPGTSSGTKLRIKGRGIERGAEKGDQYCSIKIVVPRNLEDEDRKLVEKLAANRPVNARAEVKWQG